MSNYGLSEDTVFYVPDGDDAWNRERWIAFNNMEELLTHAGGEMPTIATINLENDFFNRKRDAASMGYEARAGEAIDMIPIYIMDDILERLESAKYATGQANEQENYFTPYSEYSTIPYTSEFSQRFKQKYFRGVPHDPDTGKPYTFHDINSLYTKPEQVDFAFPRDLGDGKFQFVKGSGRVDDFGSFEHLIE